MVAAAEFIGGCPRCGGGFSSQVVRPERFACVYCGWRRYGNLEKRQAGEGRALRLRYLGTSPTLSRFPALAALIVRGVGTVAQSLMVLRIACPMCREGGALTVMDRCGQSFERWSCALGHEVRLHRVERAEVVGWS